MTMNEQERNAKKTGAAVSFMEKTAYMSGSFAQQLFTFTISSYLMLYHTSVLGISAAVSGTLFLVARFVDAVTDILMANIADRLHLKKGKYRPYILMGAIPYALFFYLNFAAPGNLGENGKIIWAFATYIICGSITGTFVTVPYGSLNSIMSESPKNRGIFASARTVGDNIGSILIAFATTTIVLVVGGDTSEQRGWTVMAMTYAVLGAGLYLFCYKGTKERVAIGGEKTSNTIFHMIGVLKGNKPLWGCMGIMCLYLLILSYVGNFTSYFCLYYLKQPAWISPVMSLPYFVSMMVAILVPRLGRYMERRNIICIGAALIALSFVFMYFAHALPTILLCRILYGAGLGFYVPNIWTMLPLASDYGEWKTGIVAPAFAVAAGGFALKVGSGLSNWLVGVVLSSIGFVSGVGEQSAAVAQGIHIGACIGPVILAAMLALCSLLFREIDRPRYLLILKELNARRNEI